MLKAIVFDLDGVLVDTVRLHYEALARALKAFGYVLTEAEHLERLDGRPTTDKLDILGISTLLRPAIITLKRRYTTELVRERCRPDYRKLTLLNELKDRYPLAVISNAHRASTLEMLAQTRLTKFFTFVVGGDEVTNPKPAPDIYLAAFEKLHAKPTECLVVEDTLIGVEAASAAGALVYRTEYRRVHAEGFASWL